MCWSVEVTSWCGISPAGWASLCRLAAVIAPLTLRPTDHCHWPRATDATYGHPDTRPFVTPTGQLANWSSLGVFVSIMTCPVPRLVHFMQPSCWSVQRSGPLHRSPWCRKSLVPRSWSRAGLGLVTENWSYSRPGPSTVSPLPTSCPASEWLMTIGIYFKVLVK